MEANAREILLTAHKKREYAFERDEGRSLTAEDEFILATIPPEANEAARLRRNDMKITARWLVVIAVILSTVTLSSTGSARGIHGGARGRGGGGAAGNLCNSGSALETSLAILDILIKPNESQKAALEELKKAAKEYSDNMSRVCAVDIPPSVPEKLAASETFLETALTGTRSLKPVAEKFYASLDDDQKAQVDSLVFWPGF